MTMDIRDITAEILTRAKSKLTAVEICALIKRDRNRDFVVLIKKYKTEQKLADAIYGQAVRAFQWPANTLPRQRIGSDYTEGAVVGKRKARFWVEVIKGNSSSESDESSLAKSLPADAGTEDSIPKPVDVAVPPPVAADLAAPLADRVVATVSRIVRDTVLAAWVKQQHKHLCQICGETIRLADGTRYSEGHHLQPLGKPHDGPDVAGNIICLCPNHHAACDLGAIPLDFAKLPRMSGHQIDQRYVVYHNTKIYRGKS